ncbi:hypothetical protein [uncultured Kordia sp.]|uniref:hypothetical protein n=1 Tax=uncultured Kordia sp. TaxID=507699 RepID=UPI0026235D68|nr:hypothetical protein [uncultured Kordia sp.]
MKKRSLKLGLNKSNISNLGNLESIKGGGHSRKDFCIESLSAAVHVCCDTTDGGGGPTGGTLCGNTQEAFCGYNTNEVHSCGHTNCMPTQNTAC